MKDTTGKNEHNRQGKTGEDAPDGPLVTYTPEQRRMFRKGLRIWAKVAIRSYMRKHGDASPLPEAAPDGGEETS